MMIVCMETPFVLLMANIANEKQNLKNAKNSGSAECRFLLTVANI